MGTTVGLLLDVYDGTGAPAAEGYAELTLNGTLTDSPDGMLITAAPVTAGFGPAGLPVVQVVANDAPGPLPAGSAWTVTFKWVPGNPAPVTVQLAAGPAAFTVTAGTPAVFTWTAPNAVMAANGLPGGTGITLAGSLPPGFTPGVTYWVTGVSATQFTLSAVPGGPALPASASGSGQLTVARYRLSGLAQVEPVELMAAYAQLGGDLSGVPALVTGLHGTPVPVPPETGTRYLRDDLTWDVPPGGGSVSTVNGQGPDGSGNVTLTAAQVSAASAAALTSEVSRAEGTESALSAAIAAAADKAYTQAFSAASVVTVTHNLGKRPSVTVTDSALDEVEGDIQYLSNAALTVSFSAPFSGTVYCN